MKMPPELKPILSPFRRGFSCFFENDSYHTHMLILDHISISVGGKEIVKDFSYTFDHGETYALLGTNGSGKSSLAFALFGHPRYTTTGNITLDHKNLIGLTPDILSSKGMFLSFQSVPEIPGIRLLEYLRTVYTHYFTRTHPGEKVPTPFVFRRIVEKLLPDYGIDPKFLDRDLYVGFS